MLKILSTLTLGLMFILMIPVLVIMISQDAVKGDFTYPIKKGFENTILAAASLTPYTKAYFAVALSNRRYEETEKLLASGAYADVSLQELVNQTSSAASDISKISSTQQRANLIADLSSSIEKYDKGLAEAQNDIDIKSQISTSKSGTSPPPSASKMPENKIVLKSVPSSSSTPVASGQKSESSAPQMNPGLQQELKGQKEAIERTRRELEELRMRLEAEQKNLQQAQKPSQKTENAPPPPPKASVSSELFNMQAGSVPSALVSPRPSPSVVTSIVPTPSPSTRGSQKNKEIGHRANGAEENDD